MNHSILEKFTVERSLIFIVISAILIVFVFVFFLFFGQFAKSIRVLTPNKGEEWEIGQTYEITWQAKGVEKVGIVLFKGTEPKWIAQDLSADPGKYEWKIYPGYEYGTGFWIAVVEYPWQQGNKIDYSDGSFVITYPATATCDEISVENQWLYLASDFPNIRRVFITKESFIGDLDGLEGADQKCQAEAEKQEFSGTWHAFLGGDSDKEVAVERLKGTVRGTDGIFVAAEPSATLIRGDTCHRLLAKNFNEFLIKQLSLADLENVWLGRLDEKSKKNCIGIASALSNTYQPLAEKYSFTATCQNWTQGSKMVEGDSGFPTCYTPTGKFTNAVALAGLASFPLSQGKYCSISQKLLCIEE